MNSFIKRIERDDLKEQKQVRTHTPEDVQKIMSKWVGLNFFDRTLLRTTYAPLKTLHHIKETDTDIVAEVVNDWEAFFTAIEEVLKEKNT